MVTNVESAAQLERWVALHNARSLFPTTVEEQRAYDVAHPDSARFLAGEDGYAWTFADGGLALAEALVVTTEARRRGLGGALYRAVSGWARELGLDRIQAQVPEDDPAGLEFALHRGFEVVSREQAVCLELAEAPTIAVEPPPGIEITTWAERDDLTRSLYEAAVEAIVDIPGFDRDPPSFETWLREDMTGPNDRADATFLAVAGGEVVGFAKLHFPAAGTTLGNDLLGVRRAWRGRGVARALKARQVAWARAAGYERLRTTNELRNEPIIRLNDRFGYRPVPGRIFVRGPLAVD